MNLPSASSFIFVMFLLGLACIALACVIGVLGARRIFRPECPARDPVLVLFNLVVGLGIACFVLIFFTAIVTTP